MKQINIGILGCGTVGSGTARILLEKQKLISDRTGINVHLKSIADIDPTRGKDLPLADGVMTTDAGAVVDDPEIQIIVELIGGKTLAKELITRAIDNGKHIVTANKALLSAHGNTLFPLAAQRGVDLAYEASVGGCMPIIKSIRESLVGNAIGSIRGILNGTCNYILSRMTAEGCAFDEVLADAQANGFAEADPTLDVDGFDAAHKLAILNAIAFGMTINLEDVYVEGIRRITPMDIEFAADFGYTVKLLAISKQTNGAVEARVHPTMISHDNILASVNGSLNAVTVSGDCVENVLLYGHGAGKMPTASAVVSDIVDIARNLVFGAPGRIPALAYRPEAIRTIPVLPIDRLHTRYYLRFTAENQPGVLSKIAGALGSHNISIKSVNQKGRFYGDHTPLVMMTYKACEADMKKALADIAALHIVADDPIVVRIEEDNGGL
ncbi:homoserine dehydrogenase [Desulfosudis oleivorans]|uniref:Homoserine dehydrogenase n=1 Tax=Desulfosudis oleivorans (strain DSM 6200 / JCM 39069 / Hxd3) TaxID=96561 RepID=A8ZS83_DESOH|nr:homoserine dehydrogenase [Desulfosudis oleivorans]ABW66101.1 Homoserine dehydrogenase [Desulfosudis oleivorans Hxd3]